MLHVLISASQLPGKSFFETVLTVPTAPSNHYFKNNKGLAALDRPENCKEACTRPLLEERGKGKGKGQGERARAKGKGR